MAPIPKTRQRDKIRLKHFELLREFITPSGFWKSPLGLIYGHRRTGKSVKIVSLLWEAKDKFGSCYRFSPTADNRQEDGTLVYGVIFPKCACFQEPSFDLLVKIRKMQNYFIRVKPVGLEERDTFCLILLDDLGSKKSVMRNPALGEYACNARNERITVIIAGQYYKQFLPEIRGNSDFFISNTVSNGTILDMLKKEIFSEFPDMATFKAGLAFYTREYGGLVKVNAGPERQALEQCTFYYNCRHIIGDFTLDCPMQELIQELVGKSEGDITDELRAEAEKEFRDADEDEYGANEPLLANGDVQYIPKPQRKKRKDRRDEDYEAYLQQLDDEYLEEEKEQKAMVERKARGELSEIDQDLFDDDDVDDPDYEVKQKPKASKSKPAARNKRDAGVRVMAKNRVYEFSRAGEAEEVD